MASIKCLVDEVQAGEKRFGGDCLHVGRDGLPARSEQRLVMLRVGDEGGMDTREYRLAQQF